MAQVFAFPHSGDVFCDPRGSNRALRVSWHPVDGLVVLSIWRDDRCVASARVATADVPALVQVLVEGLAAQPGAVEPDAAHLEVS
jgi:hypothetical protein